ncbi:hypothetical protein I79_006667 [Cricetulus griseus]|uniref:Uncharacterized protein n=1 Tax=Cricetulus griseus TaxID=10029 RepID=G3H8G7_CRIGR|nr:hypothetical protein I79_006667 [Cricetulus griseus]
MGLPHRSGVGRGWSGSAPRSPLPRFGETSSRLNSAHATAGVGHIDPRSSKMNRQAYGHPAG